MPLDASALPAHEPVQLPLAIQFDVDSKVAGRTYRIFVQRPADDAPPDGYPLVVTLDGNLCFPIVSAFARTFGAPLGPGRGALVVGVGYPTEEVLQLALGRFRDLTTPPSADAIPQAPGYPPLPPEAFGGADAFLDFITEELRPLLATTWRINEAQTTLYGHSLAGLFVLHALFRKPDAFAAFVANSPSIWWNRREILEREPAFVRAVEAGQASPRVLITVGAMEQDAPSAAPPGGNLAAEAERVAQARMVDNAAELAARLAAVKGRPGYLCRYRAFDEDDHATALATSVGRMLAFALAG